MRTSPVERGLSHSTDPSKWGRKLTAGALAAALLGASAASCEEGGLDLPGFRNIEANACLEDPEPLLPGERVATVCFYTVPGGLEVRVDSWIAITRPGAGAEIVGDVSRTGSTPVGAALSFEPGYGTSLYAEGRLLTAVEPGDEILLTCEGKLDGELDLNPAATDTTIITIANQDAETIKCVVIGD